MDNYERFQLEKYGNILPENPSDNELFESGIEELGRLAEWIDPTTEDYAKRRAIGFLEWAMEEEWQNYDGHDRWIKGRKVVETKDLYELFRKSLASS